MGPRNIAAAIILLAGIGTACLEPQRFELDVNGPDGLLSFGLAVTVNTPATSSTTPAANFSSTAITVREGDTAQSYTIQLNTQPTADVVVTITNPGAALSLSTSSLTFTSANWDMAQSIAVTGVENLVRVVADQGITLGNTTASDDADYNGLSTNVVVTLQDNDKLTFVTDLGGGGGIQASTLGGFSAADASCNADAGRPDTSVTYKAFLVGNTGGAVGRRACSTGNCGCATTCNTNEAVDWVLQANTDYFRADGTTHIGKTNAVAIFYPFPLTNSFSGAGDQIWMGLRSNWAIEAGQHCEGGGNSWTTGGPATARQGSGNQTTSSAIDNTTDSCMNFGKVMCVEQ